MEIKRIIQLRARLEKALLTYLDGKNKPFTARKDMRFINPKSDVYTDGKRQLVFLETPAINKDSIKIDVSGDSIVFSAEKNISRNPDRKYIQIERTVGTFFKTTPLAFERENILSIDHTYRLGVVKIEIEYGGIK
ncbi:MAG TPA: Hsp20/alpha crystallin family protein [bacterium]|nr:Hsp20/alpha crystallin family protein [bacterium]HPS28838.1 Hsp20/alpha crystallin family protein [bacterium]